MTFRSGISRTARLRTITLAGVAGICTAVGPLALPATATSDPALTLSSSSVRPGVPFTVSASTGCPSGYGQQSVEFSFTDSEGTYSLLGAAETGDDGAWTATSLLLPVAGIDAEGNWQGDPVASGAGVVDATCTAAEVGDDFEDASATPAQDGDEDGDDLGDNEGDDGSDLGMVTQTYAPKDLSVSGPAPRLTVSATVATPGDAVTVTPAGACPSGSAGTVEVSAVRIGSTGDEDGDDDDSDEFNESSSSSADVVAQASATTSSSGSWSAVSLSLPNDLETGDYAVTADCFVAGNAVGSYDAAPIAVGTLSIAAPVCSANGATVALNGSYSGDVAVSTARRELSLPAKVALRGTGPWKVVVSSAATDVTLTRATVTCPKPAFDLDVPKTQVGKAGKLRANVCNTGKRSVSAVLHVARGGRFTAVDSDRLAAGDCSWLAGGRLAKGDSVKARVLLDAPGSSSDEVAATFTVRRPGR